MTDVYTCPTGKRCSHAGCRHKGPHLPKDSCNERCVSVEPDGVRCALMDSVDIVLYRFEGGKVHE